MYKQEYADDLADAKGKADAMRKANGRTVFVVDDKAEGGPDTVYVSSDDPFYTIVDTDEKTDIYSYYRDVRFGNVTKSGVVYHDELSGPGGAHFTLYKEPGTTPEMIADAKVQLKNERDVTGFGVKVIGNPNDDKFKAVREYVYRKQNESMNEGIIS